MSQPFRSKAQRIAPIWVIHTASSSCQQSGGCSSIVRVVVNVWTVDKGKKEEEKDKEHPVLHIEDISGIFHVLIGPALGGTGLQQCYYRAVCQVGAKSDAGPGTTRRRDPPDRSRAPVPSYRPGIHFSYIIFQPRDSNIHQLPKILVSRLRVDVA